MRVPACVIWTLLHAVSLQAAEPYDPSRFEATPIVSGLKQPMEIAVAPDGTVFWIELQGTLLSLRPGTSQPVLVGEVRVTTAQENGLIGLALDPKFPANPWIYLQYSPPDFSGQHVSRFTLVDGKLDPASEKLLLKYEEQRKECCHHAGSLTFGPSGDLFIAAGDNTHPHGDSQGYAPIDERAERAPWDAQKSSANTNSDNGKVLRIHPNPDGTCDIPDGNLFPKDGSQGRPEIYVMGCRNPWRISVDQRTGTLYWGDVGPDAGNDGPRGPRGYDEVNQARAAGNFGWPYFIANNQPYAKVNFDTGEVGAKFDPAAPINDSPNNTGAKQLPPAQPAFIYYPYGVSTEFPEIGAAGGRTACAGPIYDFDDALKSTTKFPAEFDRTFFIYEWTRHWIKAVHLKDDQSIAKIEDFMPSQKFVRPIDMQFGPEGSLYVIEYGETWGVNADARIIRIDYIRGNRPPVVIASAENNIGKQPLTVKFSSLGTFDKDAGDALTYEWRVFPAVPADGKLPIESPVVSTVPHPEITFHEPAVFNVELVVKDRLGAKSSATIPVIVGNARPHLRFGEPQAGDFYDPEKPIAYHLLVDDAEDGTNDDAKLDAKVDNEIEPTSPTRASLNVVFVPGPVPTGGDEASLDKAPPGLRLMKRSDCFNCHAIDQKRVGPQFLEVANKYRGKDGALDASVERVLKGSTGVWGKIPMIPHVQHTPAEIREMVSWVYGLEASGLVRVFQGFVGEIPPEKLPSDKPGYYRLDATYTDRGVANIPALSAAATMYLRPRTIEAELADDVHGPRVLNGGSASSGKFAGAINDGHYLRIDRVPMNKVKRIAFKVTSAGSGGAIEVRLDAPDGPLLATAPVEVNGSWDKWYDSIVDLPATEGRHEVYLVFTNPKKAGGLMNVDTVTFLP